MKTAKKYADLKKALEKAKAYAASAKQDDDGGTCNFDSPTIDFKAMNMSKTKAIETIKQTGLNCFEWKHWDGTKLVICGMTVGQGNCRTAMAEAFHASLKADGIASGIYYQMD